MTDGAGALKTRILARLEQAINSASIQELVMARDALRQGASMPDLMLEAWKGGDPMSVGRVDQRHLMGHVFGLGKQEAWWGDGVSAVATEALAQTLQRALFDLEGQPRKWAKHVDAQWHLGYSHHFHAIVTESEQQVTMTWVTPPKGDHAGEYARYQRTLGELCDSQRPKDPDLKVASNYTRLEDIWVVTEKRWALTHGVDRKTGKWRPVAKLERNLSRAGRGVVVARQLCEDYRDRHPQKGGRGKRAR